MDLYTAIVEDIHTYGLEPRKAYTHAESHLKAVRNFSVRFPYPNYIFDQVKNERTGVILTYQDYLALERSR